MSKRKRHEAILELVQEHRVPSQEHLRELLAERGFEVTQATLSRDIENSDSSRCPEAQGTTRYTLPPEAWDQTPPLRLLLPALFVSAEGTGNLLVVKTLSGGAQPIGSAIDWEEWPEVLGTVGGDDTILLILRNPEQLPIVQRRIEELAGVET